MLSVKEASVAIRRASQTDHPVAVQRATSDADTDHPAHAMGADVLAATEAAAAPLVSTAPAPTAAAPAKRSKHSAKTHKKHQKKKKKTHKSSVSKRRKLLAERTAPRMPDKRVRKKHRFHPGTVALREIRKMQKSTVPCIRYAPFRRLIQEIIQDCATTNGARLTRGAVESLREAAETLAIDRLTTANTLAIAAGRQTIYGRDLRAASVLDVTTEQARKAANMYGMPKAAAPAAAANYATTVAANVMGHAGTTMHSVRLATARTGTDQ